MQNNNFLNMPVYLISIILIIFGITFLAAPDRVAEVIAIFIGAACTLIGLYKIITIIINWSHSTLQFYTLSYSIIILIAGLFLLFFTNLAITAIGIIIGIFAIFLGIDRFIAAKRYKNFRLVPFVLPGLLHITFGIGMVYSALAVISIIIVIIGLYLLFSGIMVLISSFTRQGS